MLEIILIAVIIIQGISHFIERRDMYNRLMAKDLAEYNQSKKTPPPKHIPSAHERVLNRWKNRAGDE